MQEPFKNYEEFMGHLFDVVNTSMDAYLSEMKLVFASAQGGYKNVLYPDLEVAHDVCREKLDRFRKDNAAEGSGTAETTKEDSSDHQTAEEENEDLMDLLVSFAMTDNENGDEEDTEEEKSAVPQPDILEAVQILCERAERSLEQGVPLPFYEICKKLEFEPFTVFCFGCAILSSTQTDYAGVFQVINENGGLSAPTIESAAKLYYGRKFSITGAYADMSVCLEQLQPILALNVIGSMPFSTLVSPDKRMIDFLFGRNPMRLDENYIQFFKMLTDGKELDPIMANSGVLEAMEISYNEGVRIFAYFGDEGSGRKFFV